MQQAGPGGDVAAWVYLPCNADSRCPSRLGRQQIVLERAMVAAVGHPYACTPPALPQRGKHGRLVQAPVWGRPGKDHPTPFGRQERRGQPFR